MEEKVLNILERVCEDKVVRQNMDINLYDTGLLDSLGFVELLVDFEDELDIVLSPSEVERTDIDTPNKMIAFLAARS